jgi:hypothetical protein
MGRPCRHVHQGCELSQGVDEPACMVGLIVAAGSTVGDKVLSIPGLHLAALGWAGHAHQSCSMYTRVYTPQH